MGIARPFRQRMKDSTDEFLVFISWHFSSVGEVLGSSGCFSSLMNRPKLGRCSYLGSAGGSPAVFGLWPQTFCRDLGELFGLSFIREDQPARRRLERPGRSRSPFFRSEEHT